MEKQRCRVGASHGTKRTNLIRCLLILAVNGLPGKMEDRLLHEHEDCLKIL